MPSENVTEERVPDGTPSRRLRVLVFTTSFPSKVQPEFGVHVKERLRILAQTSNIELHIVAPAPYFPPLKTFKRWYAWSQVPNDEIVDGLVVHRPRYPMIPRIGGLVQSKLIYLASLKYIRQLKKRFDFDLIDSHFVYPNGVAAVDLGKRFNRPVVITCRGADIAVYPQQAFVGKRIRQALRSADQLIALSEEMRGRMVQLGADDNRINSIPNGVDLAKFEMLSRDDARKQLDLPLDRPLILSVGYRLELKGFHLLVDALAQVRRTHPHAMCAIVGGQTRWGAPDYLPEIQRRIDQHQLAEHVVIAGTRPQEELKLWYSAANLSCIMSSREGSPNVMMEALACGAPLVSTRVGNVPEVLANPVLGSMIDNRSAEAAAPVLSAALSKQWDRNAIRQFAISHSWVAVASRVREVFDRAIEERE
ncbi:putative teichuronic acid biosynthesis glycosyltransferase TuaC [Planctomycetes bacterium CA13]|uniref:Putative teichuronic acid biosynthesis glycosyltransferase TuaC n=2 Tax=Novipirellula herctigrandis TaxID=2527986 RepID=A0A5C5Z1U8_9BACT|nr:putative teichuronic acid biosynthesis glycosyltransferase TuaC [Planctomycetes bacterium CA13]